MNLERFLYRYLGGHLQIGPVTFYGHNAMHFAVNVRVGRRGHFCFRPTVYQFGHWWPWYCYLSPNATPQSATWGVGPGFETEDRKQMNRRRRGEPIGERSWGAGDPQPAEEVGNNE